MPKARPWPFVEAQKIVDTVLRRDPPAEIILETGFGPSGLPHIGTFGEVARTTFVRRALAQLTDVPIRLITFSDDLDGLRKVPLNVPNREMLAEHLGRPLSSIPDPFGEEESYSAYMNRKLEKFLDAFGFEHEFRSSTQAYRSGVFDDALLGVLRHMDEITAIIAPTLGEERRVDWNPFFPICQACGRVYTTVVTATHPQRGTLEYRCEEPFEGISGCGHHDEVPVTGGHVKVGWKVDWALRWAALGVHYEMYGKDLIESANLSKRICKVLGARPPIGLFYEMFLDESGAKISKKVGKGVTVDTWLRYAPVESLLLFMYQNPRKAKRLHYEVIPQVADDILQHLRTYPDLQEEEQTWNPLWFFHEPGDPPARYRSKLDYSMIRNLVAGLGTDDPEIVVGTLRRYDPEIDPNDPRIDDLIRGAIAFDQDLVAPQRCYRTPDMDERSLLEELARRIEEEPSEEVDRLQSLAFDLARERDIKPRDLFQLFYEVLLGQRQGPRLGPFIQLMGKRELATALRGALARVMPA